MKKDIDVFMEEQNLDAIWISGASQNNPAMVYFTGIHHVSAADLFIRRGQEPILFYHNMEREEAAKTGLQTASIDERYPFKKYMQSAQGNMLKAYALLYQEMLTDLGIHEKTVAIAGRREINTVYAILSALQELLPRVRFIGQFSGSVLSRTRLTKTPDEVERIRKMGQITTSVVGKVADLLSSSPVSHNVLMAADGKALTIGLVKSNIRKWLAEAGADNPEETIFAIGRDAGVPHSAGTETDVLELGKTIVFDIFPCEAGGGYFYDFTRTWCLGYAPEEVQRIYLQVFSVHQEVIRSIKLNTPFYESQALTCRMFREMGHATIEDNQNLLEGYVHSVGHGLGLDVHESPFSGIGSAAMDTLQPGVVFTVEPGLYYPSKGFGVRIEDTVYLNEQGKAEILAEYPYELVLPVKAG